MQTKTSYVQNVITVELDEDAEWLPGEERPCKNCGILFHLKSSLIQHALRCYYKTGNPKMFPRIRRLEQYPVVKLYHIT